MTKSRSRTFPSFPFPVDGAVPVPFAGHQRSFPAFVCVTFLRTAGEEAVSLREEDSGADGEEAVEGEVAGTAVLKEYCYIFEIHDGFWDVQRGSSDVQCTLEVRYRKT